MLYNSLDAKQFPKRAMVELDLKGSSNKQLNRHLVQQLQELGPRNAPQPIGSNPVLLQSLAQLVQKEKVLLALDNVNDDSQLNGLLPPAFSSGSRVIITSRSKQLFDSADRDQVCLTHNQMQKCPHLVALTKHGTVYVCLAAAMHWP